MTLSSAEQMELMRSLAPGHPVRVALEKIGKSKAEELMRCSRDASAGIPPADHAARSYATQSQVWESLVVSLETFSEPTGDGG